MKNYIKKLCLLLIMMLAIVGCTTHSSKSYTFKVSTGDNVKVTLDTSDGYDLTQSDGQFTVKKDDKELSQGFFVDENMYKQYINVVNSQNETEIISEKENNNLKYTFYKINGQAGIEHNYIIWINDSNTGVIVASLEDESTAKKVIELLTFETE